MNRRVKIYSLALLAILILTAAVYVRIWHIQKESLDGDELFSRRAAMASPGVALDLIREDLMHPPLYYFVLKAVTTVTGTSANGIRVLSLTCGVGSILVLLSWGIALPAIRRAAWLTGALIALNSVDIFYSQQARSYALYSFWVCLLMLWAILLDRFSERSWFWALGFALMVLILYTHYVGALFIGAIMCATIISKMPRTAKLRLTLVTSAAGMAFLPWILPEVAVFRAVHGLSHNIAWQGLPTGYDLRSIWANFVGMPPMYGGSAFALCTGVLLAGFGIARSWKGAAAMDKRVATLLVATAVLPPLLLFATSFRPLSLTVFGERHLLPSIFASLMLVAFGLCEISRLMPRPAMAFSAGAICLCSLQWSETAKILFGPTREPYADIAAYLKTRIAPVYTTWPYGIGETVNFYLGSERVRPLPDKAGMPGTFVLLYRPAVSKERTELKNFLQNTSASLDHCEYYSAVESAYGTRLCVVERASLN